MAPTLYYLTILPWRVHEIEENWARRRARGGVALDLLINTTAAPRFRRRLEESSSGSSRRVGGGARNIKSMRPNSAAILFVTYFYRAGEGAWPPHPPPPPDLLLESLVWTKTYYYCPQTKFAKVMFLHMSVILSGAGGIPSCTTGHMTKHYISSCTGDQSQSVTGQHEKMIICPSLNITIRRLGGVSILQMFMTTWPHGYINMTTWLGISQFF